MSELTKKNLINVENWLKTMTDGGYCETSDANKIIRQLKDGLDKAESVIKIAQDGFIETDRGMLATDEALMALSGYKAKIF